MDTIPNPPDSIGRHQISTYDPITGDASGRQYWRVTLEEGRTAILCRYPTRMHSIVGRDLEVLIWLRHQRLPVPKIMVGNACSLWVLLEDLGNVDGEEVLKKTPASSRTERAATFLDPLVRLAVLPSRRLPSWNHPLDNVLLRWELTGFEMWSLPATRAPAAGSTLQVWLDNLAAAVAGHPQAICLRDFHLNNILIDSNGRAGVIDVQDVRLGPDTYDLASLLGDRAMPDLLIANDRNVIANRWAEAVRAAPGWKRRLQETSLQRSLKVLGTFAFLQSQGLDQYDQWIPKTASTAAGIARNLGAPSEAIAILLDLASTGGFDVW